MNTSRLEKLVNVVFIVTCLLVSALAVQRLLQKPAADPRQQLPSYSRGESLPPIAGVRYAAQEHTVLLFMTTHCPYCKEGMPFYTRLSTLRKQGRFQFVVVSPEPTKTVDEYFAANKCEVDHISTLAPGAMKVAATPTLILADREGRVSNVWRGALRDREKEVELALSTASQ